MGERLEDLMKSVLEDIKNQEYKQAYLFFGEEGYLKKQYRNKLLQAWNPDGDTMNESRFEGKGIDVKEVISLGETMPFFSDQRIILLENTGFFKNQCPELAEYLNNLPDYLYLLFVEEEVDKRSKMFKTVKQIGRVVDFAVQDEKTLMRWVLGILKREGKQITQRDMERFLSKTGTDMSNIEKELEKLLCYTMDRSVITGEDIDAVCTTQINNRIFAMVQAVAEQNQKKALDLYYDLLKQPEPEARDVALAMELRGVPKSQRQETARALMKSMGLEGFEQSYPRELSGGMKKRAAIARVLAVDPAILMMDEPFAPLDAFTRQRLQDDILSLWENTGCTILYVTHDLTEAITLADRVVLMSARPGRVVREYPIDLPRPRRVMDVKFSPRFVELERAIWQELEAQLPQEEGRR